MKKKAERSPAQMIEDEIRQALAAPFAEGVVRFKAQTVAGTRALAVAFIDARAVMDRLDEVLGISGWQDDYTVLPSGAVICRLMLRIGNEWITKSDAGGESDQKDAGDRVKSAFSEALKRAAVKFGIGRFIYRIRPQWVAYDPQKKTLAEQPRLPAEFTAPYSDEPDEPDEPEPQPVPSGELSSQQKEHLAKLMRESGADPERFCAAMGVPEGRPFTDLHPSRWVEAIDKLTRKAQKARTA